MKKTAKPSDKAKGVLLRPLKPFAETRLSEVIGSTGYKERRKTLREFDSAILREVRKRRLSCSTPMSSSACCG